MFIVLDFEAIWIVAEGQDIEDPLWVDIFGQPVLNIPPVIEDIPYDVDVDVHYSNMIHAIWCCLHVS